MNKILIIFCVFVAFGVVILTLPEGIIAVSLTGACVALAVIIMRRTGDESDFLVNIFLVALIARVLLGTMIHIYDLRLFFGGDAIAYDIWGNRLAEIWSGRISPNSDAAREVMKTNGPGWGMVYLTAGIYYIFGRNILAAQFFCAVFGAATAPLIYICSHKLFQNRRVSQISAVLVALFPAFIVWSGQLLKDGLIIFLIVLAMTIVLHLQEKFNYPAVLILVLALFGIIALRFYIFYMVAIAVVGSFVIGNSTSVKSIIRGFIALVVVGLALTYLGVLRSAGTEFEKFGSLERVQTSRLDLSRSGSGFGEDVDVSTTQGAITALPIGITYLMLAPFPWQAVNLRQAIPIPETLVWWAMIPFLLSGLWYTLKNRLRSSIPILIFTLLLSLGYSIFQGNVGTAYRQRAQIQVFLFIFVAVGWTLWREKIENRVLAKQARIRENEKRLRALQQAN